MNTYQNHHQCVSKLGTGLVATQWDKSSKHIEGYQHKTLPVFGIQWHAEAMGSTGNKLFYQFRVECWNS